LVNREFFISQLSSSLEGEDSTGGTLFLIRVADLADINKRLGREATDALLRRLAAIVGAGGTANEEGLAARMAGADFALLLPGQKAGRDVAQRLLQDLVDAMEAFVDGGPSAYIGMGTFQRGAGLRAVLSQVDAVLIAAEAEGINAVREAVIDTEEDIPRSNQEWSLAIRRALDRQWVHLVAFPVVDMQGRLLHDECPLRLKFDADDEWLPAGRFLPVAERLGFSAELDLAALALGLANLERQPELPGLAINLSGSSVGQADFQQKLATLLGRHRKVASRLWIEVAETGVLKHVDEFRALCKLLGGFQCRTGVEHFGRQFSQIGRLHDLGLSYIKVDASFTRHLDTHQGNQTFLKGVSSIAHGIGLLVIAEGVASEAEFATLAAVGFDGATGPGVKIAAS
jgi:EAL domain-containing protein (putative c-di-GMP-specific phosphodiesterase class I)/GGDEF domain-containing protein